MSGIISWLDITSITPLTEVDVILFFLSQVINMKSHKKKRSGLAQDIKVHYINNLVHYTAQQTST